eukprot:TRINITY_DN49738_c0_g1_i1.p1 TRINITY_DN49738_c0_g1~~TRINITY_DN49738_c0_g1_i1.p1  ORF type:complete len:135 (+),score=10.62 TRINITY_DN49738_c0_g1_i1:76-480(+)
MALDKFKGISPSMQVKYWGEIISKEQRPHVSHPLNTHPSDRRPSDVPPGNSKEFYHGAWNMLERRYDQAAGSPSAFVTLARRYTGVDASNTFQLRPTTGASDSSRRSHARSVSSSHRSRQPLSTPPASRHLAGY